MADTARVYIIEAVFCADRPYDYFIPPEYSDRIEPGMIIEVPFGRGNRKMTAAVYDVFDRTGDDGVRLWAGLLFLSGMGLAALAPAWKRRMGEI